MYPLKRTCYSGTGIYKTPNKHQQMRAIRETIQMHIPVVHPSAARSQFNHGFQILRQISYRNILSDPNDPTATAPPQPSESPSHLLSTSDPVSPRHRPGFKPPDFPAYDISGREANGTE